jgi:hypothetical protein
MGNCVTAFEQWKERRADVKRAEISETIEDVQNTLASSKLGIQQNIDHFERKIAKMNDDLARLRNTKKSRVSPTEIKKLMIAVLKSRKLYEKQKQKYENKMLLTEKQMMKVGELQTNTGMLKQQDALVEGLKKLGKLGINVSKIEKKLESTTDVQDAMSDINLAFDDQENADEPVLSTEDQAEIDAELEAEFDTDVAPKKARTALLSPSRQRMEAEEEAEDPAEVEMMRQVEELEVVV